MTTVDQRAEALAQSIREVIVALEVMPELSDPEAKLLHNLRFTLHLWEQAASDEESP